jgi:dTDP-4-amino-4,6-dideoxygalactose transaminase
MNSNKNQIKRKGEQEMETIKSNILNTFSGEYTSYYNLASQVLKGLRSENDPETSETKVAYAIFQAINKYASSREAINRALNSLIDTCQTELKRLHNGSALDLGWVNSNRFEEYVQETKKLWHEIETLCFIVGLNRQEIVQLADKINELIEYSK